MSTSNTIYNHAAKAGRGLKGARSSTAYGSLTSKARRGRDTAYNKAAGIHGSVIRGSSSAHNFGVKASAQLGRQASAHPSAVVGIGAGVAAGVAGVALGAAMHKHINQRNAKTAIKSSQPSGVRFNSRVGGK